MGLAICVACCGNIACDDGHKVTMKERPSLSAQEIDAAEELPTVLEKLVKLRSQWEANPTKDQSLRYRNQCRKAYEKFPDNAIIASRYTLSEWSQTKSPHAFPYLLYVLPHDYFYTLDGSRNHVLKTFVEILDHYQEHCKTYSDSEMKPLYTLMGVEHSGVIQQRLALMRDFWMAQIDIKDPAPWTEKEIKAKRSQMNNEKREDARTIWRQLVVNLVDSPERMNLKILKPLPCYRVRRIVAESEVDIVPALTAKDIWNPKDTPSFQKKILVNKIQLKKHIEKIFKEPKNEIQLRAAYGKLKNTKHKTYHSWWKEQVRRAYVEAYKKANGQMETVRKNIGIAVLKSSTEAAKTLNEKYTTTVIAYSTYVYDCRSYRPGFPGWTGHRLEVKGLPKKPLVLPIKRKHLVLDTKSTLNVGGAKINIPLQAYLHTFFEGQGLRKQKIPVLMSRTENPVAKGKLQMILSVKERVNVEKGALLRSAISEDEKDIEDEKLFSGSYAYHIPTAAWYSTDAFGVTDGNWWMKVHYCILVVYLICKYSFRVHQESQLF